jgi:hypothetical protein
LKGFKTELDKLGEVQIREAARAWLRAVIIEIPTYTGTARGTFKPLGSFLKVAIPKGTPVSNRKSKRIKGTTYQLGFGAGAQYGQDYEFNQTGLRFEFNYTVNLPYIWWNSFGPGLPELRKKAPWKAIQNGTDAFEGHLREKLPGRLSSLFSRHMTGKVIR